MGSMRLWGCLALLLVFPGAVGAAEPVPEMPPPPDPREIAPPPPSGAALLGPIQLDETTRRRFADTPYPTETLRPGRSEPPLLRIPVEEGVIFEPRVEEDPSSRMEFKGMFRIANPR